VRVDVLSLFPEMVQEALGHSIPGRAQADGHLEVGLHDIREYTQDKHRNVDDTPYGGGAGMVMNPAPVVRAIQAVKAETVEAGTKVARVVLLSPGGRRFTQQIAREYAALDGSLVLICGRYEGIDARVAEFYCDEELSIGDYVLSGGELGALVVIDAVTRLLPGALGNAASTVEESMEGGTLEYPQYTRPRDFEGHVVPEVLLSGNHGAIARWRRQKSLRLTRHNRPDLFVELKLSEDDKKLLE